MLSFIFHFQKKKKKKWKTKWISFFVFHVHKGIAKRVSWKDQNQLYGYFQKYDTHIIQKEVRVKINEIFRCKTVMCTPRIQCLERANVFWCLYYCLLLSYLFYSLSQLRYKTYWQTAIVRPSPKVVPRVIHKLFKDSKSLFKI